MKILRLVALFGLALISLGCTTLGMEPYLEKNPEVLARAKQIAGQPDRATVYLYRRYPFGTPNPGLLGPYYFAVNEQMISAMPVGTYVVLSLPPGTHKFTRLYETNPWTGTGFNRYDLMAQMEAGKSYYVGAANLGLTFSRPLQIEDPSSGEQIIQHALMAKFFHAAIPVDTFMSRSTAVRQAKVPRPANTQPSLQAGNTAMNPQNSRSTHASSTTSNTNILPSAQQVNQVLETLAVVALFGLLFVGGAALAAAGGSGTPSLVMPDVSLPSSARVTTVEQPASVTRPRPAINNPAASAAAAAALEPKTWSIHSGGTAQVQSSDKTYEVFNVTNGVRYRYEDGRVYGNDGSRYRMSGNILTSDTTGKAYQVIGNNVFSSDGRSCTRTGAIMSCN
jgi:hypothetical protein